MFKYSIITLTGISLPVALSAQQDQNASSVLELDPYVLVADRLASPSGSANGEFARWIQNEHLGILKLDTGHDLSESLYSYSGVDSYRTTPSRIAHPTTQGMSIRNIGANASSRTLVTYDGIPQNDPFGGWIYWHRYQNAGIAAVSINPSGGGETWGNLGSGGVISIISERPTARSGQISLVAGDHDTYSASIALTQEISDQTSFDFYAKHFETGGDWILHPEQRGPIDQKAGSEADAFRARIRGVAGNWSLSLSGDWFEESRRNGTPLGRNDTESYDLSFTASHSLSNEGARFTAAAYTQNRDFANVFTSVADDRASERAALDQFDVPADAMGASVSYYLPQENGGFLFAGADFRKVDGEVNERYRNLGSGFTRQRAAGGDQEFAGLFATWNQYLDTNNQITYSARFEKAETSNGFRQERNLETDTLIRNDSFADTSDTELSADIAWQHSFNEKRNIQLKAFTGFRSPTLNELYRPFRVKNDIIEANPELTNERLVGLDATFTAQFDELSDFSVSAFFYKAQDLVANAVLSTESGFNPLCGFVPGGGSCGQRLNIDESEVAGLEFDYFRQLNDEWSLYIDHVFSDTRIKEFSTLPSVEGKDLPQSPKSRASARLEYRLDNQWSFWIRGRAWSHTFEDLSNQRRVGGGHQFDLAARVTLDERTAFSLRIDNITDRLNQSGLATSGLIAIAPGRSAWLAWDQAF